MKKIIVFASVFLMFFACGKHKKADSKIPKSEKKESLIKERLTTVIYSKNDTILKFDGDSRGYGVFKWGVVGKFENISKDSIQLDLLEKDIIKSKNSLVMSQTST